MPQYEAIPEDVIFNGVAGHQALGLERVIEDGLPFCIELHEQIKIRDVASEHHATILSR